MQDRVRAGNGRDGRDGGSEWDAAAELGPREAVSDRFVGVDTRQGMVVLYGSDREVCCCG